MMFHYCDYYCLRLLCNIGKADADAANEMHVLELFVRTYLHCDAEYVLQIAEKQDELRVEWASKSNPPDVFASERHEETDHPLYSSIHARPSIQLR